MGKGRFFGSILLLVVVIVAASWNACGNSNDQGISFRALGFFQDGTGAAGDTGTCASLSNDTFVPTQKADGTLDGGFLGLQNNLALGINLDHVDLSYRVNGASVAIPNDVFALSIRLGPSSGQEPSNPSTHFAQIIIVSPNIFKFLNENRTRLPDPPFTMIAFATAVGVTDAGDVIRTNRVSFEIIFVNETCAPAPPTPVTTPQA